MASLAQSLVHFMHPHYILNIFLSLVFFLLKTLQPFCSNLFDDCELEMREWELLTFLGCVIVMKTRKTPSYAMYLETACLFAKMLSTVLFLRHSPLFGAVYVIACLLHLVFLPEPVYKGPDYITYFRGPNLEAELERDKRINWLIEFYAPWAPSCVSFAPAFAELSAKYHLDNLKFGKIDVGRYPDVGKKFWIDSSAWSKQLPTLILFKGGKEHSRRPLVDTKGKVGMKFIFCKESVERDFELAALHHECKQNPIHKGKKGKDSQKDAEPNKNNKEELSSKNAAGDGSDNNLRARKVNNDSVKDNDVNKTVEESDIKHDKVE